MKKTKTPASHKEIKQALLDILKEHPVQSFNHKQLLKKLRNAESAAIRAFAESETEKSAKRQIILQLMEELVQTGEAIEKDTGRYMVVPDQAYAEGIIDVVSSGAAYVMDENYEDDIYIAPANVKNALHGDRVKVFLYARRKNKRLEGEVVEILERARMEFAGRLQVSPKFAFLIPDSNKMHTDIFIPLKNLNGAKDGDKVIGKITEWSADARNPVGEVVRILGKPGDNNAEMDAILIEYGFPLEFPAEVEQEAERIPFVIPKSEILNRKDFRTITTFTIDPVDAKDFDDALSFRTLENGRYEIGVHIADVTHYVPENSALEKEAYKRATSVYLVDRVIPMLPEKLSNHVCSLRPNEDKLCYSAVFEMDDEGRVYKEWFGRTVIHSDRRFTYEEAQQVIETGIGDFAFELNIMNRMAKKLRSERFRKGAISFDKAEVKFRLDEKGNPLGVYLKEYKDSNKLIEEFMLLANRSVAAFIGKPAKHKNEKAKHNRPFVYRVHDAPPSDKIEDFARFASRFGYKIKTGNDKEIAHSLNQLMKEVSGKKEQNVLEQLAVRSMSKAKYSTGNIGHYGLAFDYYSHFTSPIRRYPDMMVHRLLTLYLDNQKPPAADELEKKCRHSTDMEIQAADAERNSIRFKQVQYLTGKQGQQFDAIISGVTEWGIFVELTDSKCEGLIRLREIGDDFYEFDEKNYCIRGVRSRRIFQLGDEVKVVLKKTDLEKKQIDFALVDDSYSPLQKPKKKKHRRS
jgi:ribonuclease R